MEYTLKNGKMVVIRKPIVEDAEDIIHLISTADSETRFLARNPGEFQTTVERERNIIESVLRDRHGTWFVAEYEGKLAGQCSVGLVKNLQRYVHRASVAFVVLEEYWGQGIGGKMMQECLNWCQDHAVEQVELDVVSTNERAIMMYKGFGFEPVGTQPRALRYPDGSYTDEINMIKYL